MKIKITSLGCRLNQSEIESISTLLQMRGHEITDEDDADIYIINSCAVTLKSERKTRHIIYKAMNFTGENHPERIIVTGCAGSKIQSDDNITYISNDHKYLIPDIIEKNISLDDAGEGPAERFKFTTAIKSSTSRSNLKIQDGCDNFCSYCIIPYLRGAPQSKPLTQIKDEFKELIEHDYKEIVLTGVNIGKYGYENDNLRLHNLVNELLQIEGNFRIHMTSLDPDCTDPELLELFHNEKLVRHLHLSLQRGSDTVLKRMNRPYSTKDYMKVTETLRSIDPDFNFTTDVITGFPGETDTEFNETLEFIKQVGFSHIHTFRFSPRPGTAAADMPDQIAESIKTERSKIITKLHLKQKSEYFSKFNGRESVILSEKVGDNFTSGYNEYYVPVEISTKFEKNKFYKVKTNFDLNKKSLSGVLSENN